MSKYRQTMITGASAGLGKAFAQQIAEGCDRLTIIARRESHLRALAAQIDGRCEVSMIAADLTSLEGQARVVEAIRQSPPLDLLINNAGFSTFGPFASCDLDSELQMLRLHQEATLSLTRAALPAMIEARRGAIINVASIGGFPPMPGVATYGATKAFLISFSQSLYAELADSGVSVQCLCPGYTRTEIHSRDAFKDFDVSRVPQALWMESHEVVEASLAALKDAPHQWLVIPGQHNRERVLGALTDLMAVAAA